MAERPVINLGGVDPFAWSVKVYPTASGKYDALVNVASWCVRTEEKDTAEEAKQDGCYKMADMVEELEGMIHA